MKIDAFLAISIFLCLVFLFVFIAWIFYNYRGGLEEGRLESLKQCRYCAYLFLSYDKKGIQKCPRCQSYLAPEDSNLKEPDVTEAKR